MQVWVVIRWFLTNVCTDVTLHIFHYFWIQELHGLVRYFMGEFNGCLFIYFFLIVSCYYYSVRRAI